MSRRTRFLDWLSFHADPIVVMLLAAASAVLLLWASTQALAHEWYSELEHPNGMSCCNDKDCDPTQHRGDCDTPGNCEVVIGGEWRQVPPHTVIPERWSPDGQVHVCCASGGCDRKGALIRCTVLLGQGA
jgi:hypothetical protein